MFKVTFSFEDGSMVETLAMYWYSVKNQADL